MNVNDYEIEWLTDRVILITWHKSPMDPNVTTAYIRELHEILYSVTEPIFFLSDLRKGRIQDVRALQGLAELTKHKNWGGGASFSQNPLTRIFVDTVRRLAADINTRDGIFLTPEKAIAYLESLEPHITEDIDWNAVLGLNDD
ncbi:MAG: hypothetical protein CL607_02660 [Anaerolineaceae bacterium]|nr:hypothetical protein [Anaerolineaceae bacterium]